VHLSAWPWAALAGAGLLVVAGLLLFRTGAAGGLGARFDRPAAEDTGQPSLGRGRAADPVAAAWEALDRGEDPTAWAFGAALGPDGLGVWGGARLLCSRRSWPPRDLLFARGFWAAPGSFW
jgi:hypothetical protein